MATGPLGPTATYNQGVVPGNWLKAEDNSGGRISRKNVTVADGEDLVSGQVLGQLTADGNFVAHNPAGADGSEVAAGIILFDTVASGADVFAPIIINHAAVRDESLTWAAGITGPQKTTAITELQAIDIFVRTGA